MVIQVDPLAGEGREKLWKTHGSEEADDIYENIREMRILVENTEPTRYYGEIQDLLDLVEDYKGKLEEANVYETVRDNVREGIEDRLEKFSRWGYSLECEDEIKERLNEL